MPSHKKTCIITIALFFAAIPSLMAAQVLFTPTLFLTEEYTDNVDLAPDNEQDDYIATAGLTLDSQILGRTAGLELKYSPSYRKYENNEDYDNWRHEASLYTWKAIKSNTRLELRNTYLHTNDPKDETESTDADDPIKGPAIESDTSRRGRREYYSNAAQASLSHQFGSDDSFHLTYQYRILREQDNPEGEPLKDNDISTPSVGMIYYFTTRFGTELDASYAVTDFENEEENDRDEFNGRVRFIYSFNRAFSGFIGYDHTALNYDQDIDDDEDYEIYRPSIGMTINFQDNAIITIDGGYYVQDFEVSENEEGFNVGSEIYKRWDFRNSYLGISGGSGYEIDDDGSEDNGLKIYYEGRITAGYRFTPRLSPNIFCSYRYEDFPNETPERVDKTVVTGAGFDWQALQWMIIGLSYNYSNVTSDDLTKEYNENSAMITIKMTPKSPYKLN